MLGLFLLLDLRPGQAPGSLSHPVLFCPAGNNKQEQSQGYGQKDHVERPQPTRHLRALPWLLYRSGHHCGVSTFM